MQVLPCESNNTAGCSSSGYSRAVAVKLNVIRHPYVEGEDELWKKHAASSTQQAARSRQTQERSVEVAEKWRKKKTKLYIRHRTHVQRSYSAEVSPSRENYLLNPFRTSPHVFWGQKYLELVWDNICSIIVVKGLSCRSLSYIAVLAGLRLPRAQKGIISANSREKKQTGSAKEKNTIITEAGPFEAALFTARSTLHVCPASSTKWSALWALFRPERLKSNLKLETVSLALYALFGIRPHFTWSDTIPGIRYVLQHYAHFIFYRY